MAAHRYWRVRVSADPQNAGNTSCAELALLESIGGSNTIGSGTIGSSSDFSGFPKGNAVDGNTSTFWAANNSYPTYLSYDFGSGVTKDIVAVEWTNRSDSNIQVPQRGDVQYSDDGSTWTTAWEYNTRATTNNVPAGVVQKFSDPALQKAVTWNPDDAGTSCYVDDAFRRARCVVSAVNAGCRTSQLLVGKMYFEVVVEGSLTGSNRVGAANSSWSPATLLGNDTSSNGIGYGENGTVRRNNTTVTTIATYTSGDRIGIAVDRINNKIWFRVNNGNWNNDVIANQNPVGAVGGIDISAIVGPIQAAFGGTFRSGVKANFDSSHWVDTAPTGFVAMSATTTVVAYATAKAARDAAISNAWYGGIQFYSPAAGATHVSGVVTESGSPVSGKLVSLYDAATGILLGTDTSDGSGLFSIHALGRTNVFAVAQDPTYQAIVYDQLVPV